MIHCVAGQLALVLGFCEASCAGMRAERTDGDKRMMYVDGLWAVVAAAEMDGLNRCGLGRLGLGLG